MFLTPLKATGIVTFGDASPRKVGRITFQIVGDAGGWSGSAVVKARVAGANILDAELVAIPYVNVGTGVVLDPSTAITAEGIYEAAANGLEVVLDYTHTSGLATAYVVPLEGNGAPVIPVP